MSIQWFPGHMAKTRRLLIEQKKDIDVVIEIIDARAPLSSVNMYLEEVLADKPKIYLLNKSDLADPKVTELWINKFNLLNIPVISVNALKGIGIKKITKTVEELVLTKKARYVNLGMKNIPIRAAIIGIPNVGKSTLLNRLVGKNVAQVENKPGLTKKLLWYKVNDNFKILDTPGMLWPKFSSPEIGYRIALLNSIANYTYDPEQVANFFLEFLASNYPNISNQYFSGLSSLTEVNNEKDIDDLTEFSKDIIKNFRSLKYGRLTIELPNE